MTNLDSILKSREITLSTKVHLVKAMVFPVVMYGCAVKEEEVLEYKGLTLNIPQKKVSIDGTEVPLTKKEFEILMLFLQNKGRVFSREDILAKVWNDEVYVLDRTIDVNITRLRKKIGEYGKRIVTRLGYGYCFECE